MLFHAVLERRSGQEEPRRKREGTGPVAVEPEAVSAGEGL